MGIFTFSDIALYSPDALADYPENENSIADAKFPPDGLPTTSVDTKSTGLHNGACCPVSQANA